MAVHGAQLQSFNNELVQCIEDLCEERDSLNRVIQDKEEEKAKIEYDVQLLQERLDKINGFLTTKYSKRDEYDKTIRQSEDAYVKILESSQSLLQMVKRESHLFDKPRLGG